MKKIAVTLLAGVMALSLAACGGTSSAKSEAKTYSVSYNLNTNADEMPDYQFLKSDTSAVIQYEARAFMNIDLTVDGDTYVLTAEEFTSNDGEERIEFGAGDGIALSVKTVASGNCTTNEDGMITIDTPTDVTYSIQTDVYSEQLVTSMDLGYGEDECDGEWTLADTPSLADQVPSTVFTVDAENGSITTYARA